MSSTQEVGEIFGAANGPASSLLRSPTVIIASIGLWGMNVYLFRLFGIDYRRVLMLDLIKEKVAKEGRDGSGRGGGRSKSISDGGEGLMQNEDALDKMEKRSDAGGHNAEAELASLIADGSGGVGNSALSSPAVMDIPPSPGAGSGDQGVKSRAAAKVSASTPPPGSGSASPEDPSTPSKTMTLSKQQPPSSAQMTALLESGKPNCDGITAFNLLALSLALLLTLHVSTYAYIHLRGGSTIGAIFAFYAVVCVAIVVPLPRTRWIRVAARTVLGRALELLNPRCACVTGDAPRPIPFVDVFFADAMCSLSKVFFDWGMLWHLASHYPDPVPPSFHAIVIPSLCASLPYLCRARQCLIMYEVGRLKDDPKRYQHVLNAIKYSTSLFPLIVSASTKTDVGARHQAALERLLIILMVVNSLYSFIWDVVMDWGMMDNPRVVLVSTLTPCSSAAELIPSLDSDLPGGSGGDSRLHGHHPFDTLVSHDCSRAFLRPRLRFGPSTSVTILVADAFLRFFWVVRFVSSKIFPSNDAFVLCTEFLEVFRRAIWNLLRVEWENIKQGRAAAAGGGGGGRGGAKGPGASSLLMTAPSIGGLGNGGGSESQEVAALTKNGATGSVTVIPLRR